MVRFIILYGAASQDRIREGSDIDISVCNESKDIYDIKIFEKFSRLGLAKDGI